MCLRRQRRVGINPSDRVEPTKEVGREDLTCFFPLNQTVQLYDDQLLLGRVKPPFCVSTELSFSGYLLSREAPQVAQCSDDSLHTRSKNRVESTGITQHALLQSHIPKHGGTPGGYTRDF